MHTWDLYYWFSFLMHKLYVYTNKPYVGNYYKIHMLNINKLYFAVLLILRIYKQSN